MREKAIKNKINKLFNKALNKQRPCCVKDCKGSAINSHILQKNGIISGIATNKHVISQKFDFLHDELFKFKRTGINITYTFKGLCNKHDKEIFQPIEDYEIDFEDNKSQLLFVYRTILNEKRKKEVSNNWVKSQLADKEINNTLNLSQSEEMIEGHNQAIKDLSFFENIVVSDLDSLEGKFVFKVRYVKEHEVCLTSFFTYETTRQLSKEFKKTGKHRERLTEIFISFFPLEGENVVMIGYLKEQEDNCKEYIDGLFRMNENDFLKQISNFLLYRCEDWICSEAFYNTNVKPREKEIIEIFKEAAESIDEDKDLGLNIFEI